jgi:hypothetical protein
MGWLDGQLAAKVGWEWPGRPAWVGLIQCSIYVDWGGTLLSCCVRGAEVLLLM